VKFENTTRITNRKLQKHQKKGNQLWGQETFKKRPKNNKPTGGGGGEGRQKKKQQPSRGVKNNKIAVRVRGARVGGETKQGRGRPWKKDAKKVRMRISKPMQRGGGAG